MMSSLEFLFIRMKGIPKLKRSNTLCEKTLNLKTLPKRTVEIQGYRITG